MTTFLIVLLLSRMGFLRFVGSYRKDIYRVRTGTLSRDQVLHPKGVVEVFVTRKLIRKCIILPMGLTSGNASPATVAFKATSITSIRIMHNLALPSEYSDSCLLRPHQPQIFRRTSTSEAMVNASIPGPGVELKMTQKLRTCRKGN